VSIYYGPESNTWVKIYDHLNFSRASDVHFRVSRYIIHLIQTSECKVMTIWISRELLLPNFNRLDILLAWIGHPSEKLWPFEFLESLWFAISSVSMYYAPGFGHPSEKLWPFEFLESIHCSISSISIYYFPESDICVKSYDHLNFCKDSVLQFRASGYTMRLNWTSESKVMTIWTSRELPLFNFEHLDILFTWFGHPS